MSSQWTAEEVAKMQIALSSPPVRLNYLPDLPGIPATAEMRAAGAVVYDAAREDFERSDLDAIYRAMAALAPVELVSEGERQAVRERDAANTRNRLLEATIEGQHRAMLAAQEREIALRTELMAVHDKLVGRAAVNVPGSPRPDWTRVPEPDRWRMGPEGI